MGYGKIFDSTYTGSMYGSGPVAFAVWGYVIANTVSSVVELNPKFLAPIIGCSASEIKTAIEYFCEADPDSRNSDHEGRRLVPQGPFQYFVVSHSYYRQMRSEDDRREYNRKKATEYRAAHGAETGKPGRKPAKKANSSNNGSNKEVIETKDDKRQNEIRGTGVNESTQIIELVYQSNKQEAVSNKQQQQDGAAAEKNSVKSIRQTSAQSVIDELGNENTPHQSIVDNFNLIGDELVEIGPVSATVIPQIIDNCVKEKADVTLDEIVWAVREQVHRAKRKGRDPMAFVIGTVGGMVGGDGYSKYQAAKAKAEEASRQVVASSFEHVWWSQIKPEAAHEAGVYWRLILSGLEKLEKPIPRPSIDIWLKPAIAIDVRGRVLYLRVPSPHFHNIGERYGNRIRAAIAQELIPIDDFCILTQPGDWPGEFAEPEKVAAEA